MTDNHGKRDKPGLYPRRKVSVHARRDTAPLMQVRITHTDEVVFVHFPGLAPQGGIFRPGIPAASESNKP